MSSDNFFSRPRRSSKSNQDPQISADELQEQSPKRVRPKRKQQLVQKPDRKEIVQDEKQTLQDRIETKLDTIQDHHPKLQDREGLAKFIPPLPIKDDIEGGKLNLSKACKLSKIPEEDKLEVFDASLEPFKLFDLKKYEESRKADLQLFKCKDRNNNNHKPLDETFDSLRIFLEMVFLFICLICVYKAVPPVLTKFGLIKNECAGTFGENCIVF